MPKTLHNSGPLRQGPYLKRGEPLFTMLLDARIVEGDHALEIYFTAASARQARWQEAFTAIADLLRRRRAGIFYERIFAHQALIDTLAGARTAAYGELDDGVVPTWLVAPEGLGGPIAGIQLHAVCATRPIEVLRLSGSPQGRVVDVNGRKHIAICGVRAPEASAPASQARGMFERTESVLHQAGGEMSCVARTWLWLGDILSWYEALNDVRTEFLIQRGLMGQGGGEARLPASTGIGVRPAGAGACAMDTLAVCGPGEPISYFAAAGRQDSPLKYGSAFSRAVQAASPAGRTVYVSGTASIDAEGRTQHPGDAEGQIATSLANCQAVLDQLGCRSQDVVQATAYCKTPEVAAAWQEMGRELDWPCVTVLADICRPELVFEIEVTAVAGARRL